MQFQSEKSEEIVSKQKPMTVSVIDRVKMSLAEKNVVLDQSAEWDAYLMANGTEAITFSDGTIILHTRVSASGFFEELIHYGQVMSGRAVPGDEENTLLMEIEAQERLIKHQSAYGITDYEIEVLRSNLCHYCNQLGVLRGRR